MSDGIPLGTIAGVPVRANWSVLVLLWLFAWSLATTLPQTVSGYHTRDYWVAGVIGAVVLLMSLLAHEATHALVARRAGMEVSSVTLWMFGGVTRVEGEAKTPRTQSWIAFSGPLTSLLLSAIFAGVAASLRGVAAAPLAVGWRGGCRGLICCWRCSICCRDRPWTAAGCCRRFCGVDTATRHAPPWAPPAPDGYSVPPGQAPNG